MKYIVKYQCFNESKGISDSCEKILYKIWSNLEKDIRLEKNGVYTFDINEIDFNVKDLKIIYNIELGDENQCYSTSNLKDSFLDKNKYLNNSSISIDIKKLKLTMNSYII